MRYHQLPQSLPQKNKSLPCDRHPNIFLSPSRHKQPARWHLPAGELLPPRSNSHLHLHLHSRLVVSFVATLSRCNFAAAESVRCARGPGSQTKQDPRMSHPPSTPPHSPPPTKTLDRPPPSPSPPSFRHYSVRNKQNQNGIFVFVISTPRPAELPAGTVMITFTKMAVLIQGPASFPFSPSPIPSCHPPISR